MMSPHSNEEYKYREFQFSWLLTGILVPIHLLITYLYLNGLGERPMQRAEFLIISGILTLTFLIFYGMSTRVNSKRILVLFGIGLFRKSVYLDSIRSAEVVRTPWYYGYGIRLIPNGWLYNVSGGNAVELRFHDRKGIIMIGSRNAGNLKRAIELCKNRERS